MEIIVMPEGLPLPWPFPWFVPIASTTSAASRSGLPSNSSKRSLAHLDVGPPFLEQVYLKADELSKMFGQALPVVKSAELYLVEGLADVAIAENTSPVVSKSGLAVIYPPEFLFVVDVGLPHLIGGSVLWQPVGYGDPGFPEKNEIALRSIRSRSSGHLIFPKIAGSLMIGVKEDADLATVEKELLGFGLRNVDAASSFITADCAPFQEDPICRQLEGQFDFIKYAEVNGVVRLIDFSPGWFVKRLL